MRRVARLLLLLLSLGAGALAAYGLVTHPFAAPIAQRTTDEVRVALDRAMARRLDAGWLAPRIEAALAAEDRDRLRLYADLGVEYGVALPEDLVHRVEAALAPPPLAGRAAACGACAWDPVFCVDLAHLAACALPVELTPLGDVNALRRQARNALAGDAVDRVETGLALAGLGATGLVAFTGGTSYAVKSGASLVRIARRTGRVTPELGRVLGDAADIPVAWHRVDDFVLGRAGLGAVTDTARLGRLGAVTGDLGRIVRNTSPVDALALLPRIETAEDAARMARVSDAMGPATRPAMEVLGPARAFRALTRVSDWVVGLAGLAAALLTQGLGLAVASLFRAARRAI
ncbi:MAG: hypothetical protein AAFR35_01540 [Pseudomonadota bacterium]